MNTLANADSNTLRNLSNQMNDSLTEFNRIDTNMENALKEAGSVWQDPQYGKFIGIYHSTIDDIKSHMIGQLGKYKKFLDELATSVETYDTND